MFEFLAGFIVGINVGIGVWSLLRMGSIQAADPSERGLVSEGVQDPARATSDPATTSDPDWAWAA
jgi:hypothetical protein